MAPKSGRAARLSSRSPVSPRSHTCNMPRRQPASNPLNSKEGDGAARGIRTPDPLITNEVLYQLSYCGIANVTIREVALLPPRLPVGKAERPETPYRAE